MPTVGCADPVPPSAAPGSVTPHGGDPPPAAPARTPAWHEATRLQRGRVPVAVQSWLLADGSLTAHVRARCVRGFRLRVLRQQRACPRRDEARALGVAAGRPALVREVALCDGAFPLVVARTVLPFASLRGPGTRFAALGRRPLGALLFATRSAQRGSFALACLDPRQAGVAPPPGAVGRVWGRRAVFRVAGAPLLVSEFFLPALFRTKA